MVDTELRQQVNSQGYALGDIETYSGVPRVTLYREELVSGNDGKPKTTWLAHKNLPGDADSLKKYFRRGMRLSPPEEKVDSDHPLIDINPSFIKDATLDKNGNPLI